jgi:hypothetical protein
MSDHPSRPLFPEGQAPAVTGRQVSSPARVLLRRRRRWWWKAFWIIFLIGLLAVSAGTGIYLYYQSVADRQLQEAVTEADQLDPGWRLDELDAKRKIIPNDQNAALQVMAAVKALPETWTRGNRTHWNHLYEDLDRVLPNVRLDEQQTGLLRKQLEPLQGAVIQARKLVQLTNGRYPISWSPDFIQTLVPNQMRMSEIAALLRCDAVLLAQQGDVEGAWMSSHAMINASRSLGDEPLLLSALLRVGARRVALESMERTLAQGQPSEAALTKSQKLLEEEAAEPLLLVALRGERAGLHHLFSNLEAGKVKLDQIGGAKTPEAKAAAHEVEPTLGELAKHVVVVLRIKQAHARGLKYMTHAVEIAKKPLDEQEPLFRQLDVAQDSAPWQLASLFTLAQGRVVVHLTKARAQLRCAIAGLAAERYRRNHGHWAASLDALAAAGFLPGVPSDPYTGQPLRYRLTADGVVIYSLGRDGSYQGDSFDDAIHPTFAASSVSCAYSPFRANPFAVALSACIRTPPREPDPGTARLEFRLWNVDNRRQSPRPVWRPVELLQSQDQPDPGS